MKQVLCEKCNIRVATDKHHLLSQTVWARKLYNNLIDAPENIQYLCKDCHLNKPVDKISETEFCKRLNIELRSKKVNKF
jgi:5-methylcytosine-specific restriction endonuclease McrA